VIKLIGTNPNQVPLNQFLGTMAFQDAASIRVDAITSTLFTGSGAGLTSIPNSATTAASANGASTIVARDAAGNVAFNGVTANIFTGAVSGNGALLTALNGTNVTTGTVANARTTATDANTVSTIIARDASGNFAAGAITSGGTGFSGPGVNISTLNGANVTSGTIANARTTATDANNVSTIIARDASGNFAAGAITSGGSGFSGPGVNISTLNGTNVTTGTIANARTTATNANTVSTIVARDASGAFSAGAITALSFSGSGSGLTAASIPNSATSAASANGASTIVARDAAGNAAFNGLTANFFTGSGALLTSIPNSATTATSANGASTIVARDASGNTVLNGLTAAVVKTASVYNTTSANLIFGIISTESFRVSPGGNVVMGFTVDSGYKLQVNGSFAATTKSFLIEHPTKDGMKLRHGSLEGPENGVYVRGRSNTGVIMLPDYWIGLVDESTITVNLTAIGKSQRLYVDKIENNYIWIQNRDALEGVNYFYTVYGERKDVDKMLVEISV